jgi:hypothetical protein
MKYRHFLPNTLVNFWKFRLKSELSVLVFRRTDLGYTQESPVSITVNVIGCSMTAPSPVIAQQYSFATFVSFCFHFDKEIFVPLLKNIVTVFKFLN